MTHSARALRDYHTTHTELEQIRLAKLGTCPFSETMAAILAGSEFDLNDHDSVVFGLSRHGFSAREILGTVDLAVSRAFALRRERIPQPDATPAGSVVDVRSGVAAGRDRPSYSPSERPRSVQPPVDAMTQVAPVARPPAAGLSHGDAA